VNPDTGEWKPDMPLTPAGWPRAAVGERVILELKNGTRVRASVRDINRNTVRLRTLGLEADPARHVES